MREPLTFAPFAVDNLEGLTLQAQQSAEQMLLAEHDFPMDAIMPAFSFTALRAGHPVGCGGLVRQWSHRAAAWAYVGAGLDWRDWPQVTAQVREVLDRAAAVGFRRIEATANIDHPAARRWLTKLGFHCETPYPMPLYGPDGSAHFLYSRIKL